MVHHYHVQVVIILVQHVHKLQQIVHHVILQQIKEYYQVIHVHVVQDSIIVDQLYVQVVAILVLLVIVQAV